jgi:hypothetical protein
VLTTKGRNSNDPDVNGPGLSRRSLTRELDASLNLITVDEGPFCRSVEPGYSIGRRLGGSAWIRRRRRLNSTSPYGEDTDAV